MRNIKFLQVVSFASRISAMLIGIFQSLLIVNILTTSEFGLIGLVASIAGVVGIAQHLGLASSSTKEISAAKNDTEVFHIALTSISIRYLISLPTAILLIFFAGWIANYYSNIDLVTPLRIFGLVLLIQALQSIFNSIIAGKHEFKKLFTYQVLIAFVSLFVFLPLVYFYKVLGYFYALLIFNLIQTVALGALSLGGLKFKFSLPTRNEYKKLFVDLLKVSMAIYAVKVIFTAWQELPVLILGQDYSLETIAIFAFALNFSSKLMAISDSVTDVNLPVFSKKASDSLEEFFKSFNENFNFLYSVILVIGSLIVYWSQEILKVADYLTYMLAKILNLNLSKNIYDKYSAAIYLFFPLIISIIFYSYLNILKSSIYVPLSRLRKLINSFILMFFLTFGLYYALLKLNYFPADGLLIMSWSLALGSFFAFVYCFFDILTSYKNQIVTSKNISLTMLSFSLCFFTYFSLPVLTKLIYFSFYFLMVTFVYKINIFKIILKKANK